MARLKWGGKLSPLAFIVAETPDEEAYILSSDKEINRGTLDGKAAFILSATVPLDDLHSLLKEVSLSVHREKMFPGRTFLVPMNKSSL